MTIEDNADDTIITGSTEPTREELIAEFERAAQEAGSEGHEEKPAASLGTDTTETPSKTVSNTTETSDEPTELEKMLAQREERAKARAKERDELESEHARILREATEEATKQREAAQKEAEEARRRAQISLRENPLATMRELGVDPKRVLDEAIHEDDPYYKKIRSLEKQLEEKSSKIDAHEKRIQDWDKQNEELKARAEQEARLAARTAAENEIVELRNAHPEVDELRSYYGSSEKAFKVQAHQAADELREYMDDPKFQPTVAQIFEWMVRQVREEKKKAANVEPGSKTSQKPSGTASKENGPQRTIGSTDATQRRSSTKDYSAMTPAEQRADLIAMVAEMQGKG